MLANKNSLYHEPLVDHNLVTPPNNCIGNRFGNARRTDVNVDLEVVGTFKIVAF